jgi:hypothetical protein
VFSLQQARDRLVPARDQHAWATLDSLLLDWLSDPA